MFCWEGRKDKWHGFSENVGGRTCEKKNQKIFNNKVAQGNILDEMKSGLENVGKFCKGETAMRRRERTVVSWNSALSSRSHLRKCDPGTSAPIYLFLALHFS